MRHCETEDLVPQHFAAEWSSVMQVKSRVRVAGVVAAAADAVVAAVAAPGIDLANDTD